MTTKKDEATEELQAPDESTEQVDLRRITVRANAAVLGLRAFEVAEVTEDLEVKALLAVGLLERA